MDVEKVNVTNPTGATTTHTTPTTSVSEPKQNPHGGIVVDVPRSASPSSYSYPSPLATYEEVVQDGTLFMHTLEKLHRFMGTKFMIPTIGGKSLDLHRLFVEVTSRGGLEKVIGDRKWKEVISAFNFPSTITSASFVLRKYYLSLLHTYEQLYFFQNKDSKIPVTDGSSETVRTHFTMATMANSCLPNTITAETTNELTSLNSGLPDTSSLQPGSLVSGEIKAKFEHGYIITANFGSAKLNGVLYHVPVEESEPPRSSYVVQQLHCERKKSRKVMKDPSRPKSHRSGYNFFFAEQCAKLKPLYSREERAVRIGDMWNNLSTMEKEVYQQKGIKDVERYRIEMLEYKNLRMLQNQTNIIITGITTQMRRKGREQEEQITEEEEDDVLLKLESNI